MPAFYALILAAAIGISGFLITSFSSIQNFTKQSTALVDYETTALAAANRISKETSSFLTELELNLSKALNDPSFEPSHSAQELLSFLGRELETGSNNQLTATLNQGLHGKQDYKLELLHSNYYPLKRKPSDPSFLSTTIKPSSADADSRALASDLRIEPLRDFEDFYSNETLLVSKKLLEDLLFTESEIQAISKNASRFGVKLSNEGLRIEDLPNGLKLFLSKRSFISDKTSTEADEYMSHTALAQLRLQERSETNIVYNPEPQVITPVVPVPPVIIRTRVQELERLNLNLSMIPLSERGFLYDPSRVIDASNPLEIVNLREGGYSAVHVRDDGYLQVSIGSIETRLGSGNILNYYKTAALISDPASLIFYSERFDTSPNVEVRINETNINLDVAPRGRTNYTTASSSFVVNGVTIPQGAVIVAVRQPGVTDRHPGLRQYEHFRAYDAKTGKLISYFGANGLERAGCLGGTHCMDIRQFAVVKGVTTNNQDVFYSFSVGQLFTGLSAYDSALAWANIQRDLEQKLINDLNAGKENWQREELKLLNQELKVYTGNLVIDNLDFNNYGELERLLADYKSRGINGLKRSLGISDELPSLSRLRYSTTEINDLRSKLEALNNSLAVFALTKISTWLDFDEEGLSENQINNKKSEIKTARENFLRAKEAYESHLKLYGNSFNLLTKEELLALLNTPNLDMRLRQEYQAELDKMRQEEETQRLQAELQRQQTINLIKLLEDQLVVINRELAVLRLEEARLLEIRENRKKKKLSVENINKRIKEIRKSIKNHEIIVQMNTQNINKYKSMI
jgi:hypothetical protein